MAEETEPDTGKGEILGVGELRAFITETVKSAVAGLSGASSGEKDTGKTDDKGVSGSDISAQVKRELARVREHEARQKRDEEIDTTLKALQERTAEKQPVERRKVHKFMGWGD
jgi:hypothetical protein